MYTEVYWYRYTPYTWGVSIYDDWYYYGGNVSRHSWTSGFGGSYWWGYEPWWGYSPGIGYGWNSWHGHGVSYSVNYYLGRPHYHYPVAYSGWNNYRYGNYSRPLTVINNNTYNYYYGSEKRNSNQGASSGYNPATPYPSGRRAGYTTTGGRSSTAGTTPVSSGSGSTRTDTRSGSQADTRSSSPADTRSGSQADTRSSTRTGTRSTTQAGTRSGNQGGGATGNQTGNSGNAQSDGEKDKSNNGLRMGQYRRGVAEPANPGDNGLPRTNNPNINDRTDPGREQGNARNTASEDPGLCEDHLTASRDSHAPGKSFRIQHTRRNHCSAEKGKEYRKLIRSKHSGQRIEENDGSGLKKTIIVRPPGIIGTKFV